MRRVRPATRVGTFSIRSISERGGGQSRQYEGKNYQQGATEVTRRHLSRWLTLPAATIDYLNRHIPFFFKRCFVRNKGRALQGYCDKL